MAITTPTSLQVPAAYETMLPKMAKQPLQKVLEDLNYLHVYHRPALASVCLTTAGALTRTAVFIIPVTPSADGVKYGIETRIYCSAACNLSIAIDYCTTYAYNSGGPWTNLLDHTGAHAIVVGAAGLVTQVDTGAAIPATATALRLSVSVDAGNMTAHHLLAYPAPDAPTVGSYPSGFLLFDDGLLASGQHAPITTEHLNRCRVSADAIRLDRWQNLFSWCQEEVQANSRVVLDNISAATHFPRVRCWLPAAGIVDGQTVQVTVKAIVTTDDASQTNGAVLLQELGSGVGVGFNAETTTGTVTIQSATMGVTPQGTGLLRYVDLELSGLTAGSQKTYIHSVMAFWRPGPAAGDLITAAATPPAEAHLLKAAVAAVLDLAAMPYTGVGHLFEGGTTGLEDRYFAVSVAPASKHCRVALTNAFGTAAPASYSGTPNDWWTTTGGTTGNNICRVPVPNGGARDFPSSTVKYVGVALVTSSDYAKDNTASLTAPADRLGELAEHRAPQVEPMYCKHACGVSVVVSEHSADLASCPA